MNLLPTTPQKTPPISFPVHSLFIHAPQVRPLANMTGPAVCIAYRSLERPRGLARKGCPERVAARTDPLPNDYHVALGLVMPFLSQQDQ